MKRSVYYVTDSSSSYHQGKSREQMTVAETSMTDMSPGWRQAVMAAGVIGQPWHHKLMQIRKELYK
ncbi:hypothetical protein [Paenibacillus fonticola]|uniref:hypothetical protein n=1 Tax=Paenibacillus fonticola TaxID=379896 RepID=UPI00039FC234|nr:hypothetical protein [Paenibacillus fonticola]